MGEDELDERVRWCEEEEQRKKKNRAEGQSEDRQKSKGFFLDRFILPINKYAIRVKGKKVPAKEKTLQKKRKREMNRITWERKIGQQNLETEIINL